MRTYCHSLIVTRNSPWHTTSPGKQRSTLIAMLFHYLERLIDFWREVGGLTAANEKLLAQIVWPHFWAIQLLLLVMVLMYCTMRELVREIGRDKVIHIFFGPLSSTP
ncbi:hypothetical protein [Pseudomonas fluorescens]|uniref:hypothetical protein n=1 Tax=Pseudomonas fluorescens TaxID=294 RepID=UPI002181EBB6|nr:hypothetical protein [Pseudomonas fluorescens]